MIRKYLQLMVLFVVLTATTVLSSENKQSNFSNASINAVATVTSTVGGGNWNDTATWIGKVLPTAIDDVIINGHVFVDKDVECNNLTINAGDTLQKNKDNTTRTLTVNGDLLNNGVMMKDGNELYSYIFHVNVLGNITNAGTIFYVYTKFAGTSDQYLSTTATSIWKDGRIEDSDSSTAIIAATSLYFHDDLLIRLDDSNNKYCSIILPKDSGYNIYGNGTVQFDKLNILGNGNELHLSNKAQLWTYVKLNNISLKGNTVIVDDINFMDSVINVDTISNESALSRYFNAYGTFTNKGIVLGASSSSTVRATIYGDIINEGVWKNCRVDVKGDKDQTITLNNSSTIGSEMRIYANVDGASTYQWKKDGASIDLETSSILNLDSLYSATEGKYTCTTDLGESRVILLGSEGVAPKVIAAFSTDTTSGYAPLTVKFEDLSEGSPTSWSWDFDNDGTEDSDEQNPTYTYDVAATYTVKLTVSNETSTDDTVMTDLILVKDVKAAFSIDTTSGLAPLEVKFEDLSEGSPTSWSWDFDNDGTEDSDEQNPTYTYDVAATYTVKLSVSNGTSTDDTVMTDLIVVSMPAALPLPFEEYFEYSNKILPSKYTQIDVDGDGNVFMASNVLSYEGSYSCMVYTGGGAGENWLILPKLALTADENIQLSFYAKAEYDNYPETFEVLVSTNGIDINDFTAVSSVETPGENFTKYAYDLSEYAGKEAFVAIHHKTSKGWRFWMDELKVQTTEATALSADFSADKTSGDAPLAVKFTDLSDGEPSAWSWDFDNDGEEDSDEQNPEHTFSKAGKYTVKLTVTKGSDSDSEEKTDYITVNEVVAECLAANNYVMNFEDEDDFSGWKYMDANNDEQSWKFYENEGVGGSIVAGYEFSEVNAADDWLFTPCFDLEQGKDYQISFYYACEDADYSESINLYYGKEISASMDNLLAELTNFNNVDFIKSTSFLSPTETGSYHFGWHCISSANSYYAFIDSVSISIDEHTSTGISDLTTELLNVYPNPASNLVSVSLVEGVTGNLSCYNLTGQLVLSREIQSANTQIDISSLNKGVYIMHMQGNNKLFTKRLIVE